MPAFQFKEFGETLVATTSGGIVSIAIISALGTYYSSDIDELAGVGIVITISELIALFKYGGDTTRAIMISITAPVMLFLMVQLIEKPQLFVSFANSLVGK